MPTGSGGQERYFICSIDLRPSLGRVEQLVMICMVERRSHLEACSLTCQLLGWRNSSLASPGTTDQKVFLASAYGRGGLLLTRVPREFRTPKSVLWGVRWKMWGLLWPNSEVTWCHFCHTRLVKAVISPPRCQERNIDPISQLKMCQKIFSYFFKNCTQLAFLGHTSQERNLGEICKMWSLKLFTYFYFLFFGWAVQHVRF